MVGVLLAIQVVIVVALVAFVLLQKTSADSLAGLAGGGNSILSARSTSGFLSKATAILAVCFFINCIAIAKVINSQHKQDNSFFDNMGAPVSEPVKNIAPKVAE